MAKSGRLFTINHMVITEARWVTFCEFILRQGFLRQGFLRQAQDERDSGERCFFLSFGLKDALINSVRPELVEGHNI